MSELEDRIKQLTDELERLADSHDPHGSLSTPNAEMRSWPWTGRLINETAAGCWRGCAHRLRELLSGTPPAPR